ncbi:hypothetical protein H6P81_014425 [Aristolochia fimbriata]|uniref:Uncharacterized protein n=1 Tax=Aristolochia fimbriata TaxID=158543 RepID=A0AAV7EHJ4_ARIFI|nr:hypothetical protein H6P81_014425 [Aristolochia fimbriata]
MESGGISAEGRLVHLCIEAATRSRESVEKWRRQRRTLERMPAPLAEALLRQLLRRRLAFPSLLEVFQNCIEEIDLSGETFVDAEWLAYLGSFRHLRTLNLADCRGVTNSSLWPLAGMTSLKELDLSRCSKITDAGYEHLLSVPNLEKLFISGTGITTKALMRLSSFRKMHALDLGGLPVTDLVLSSVKGLTQLEHLDLWGSKISDVGAAVLKVFPKLSFLNLAWTNVTKLPNLPSLSCLNMSNCNIQSIFKAELEAKVPLLKLLLLGAELVDVHGAFSALDLRHLSFLDVSGSSIVDFYFLGNLAGLEHLNLSHCRMVDSLMDSVASAGTTLRYLNLAHTRVSSDGVAVLAGSMPYLETLSLSYTSVDDAVLSYISLMPSLREVDLSHTNIKGFICQGSEHDQKVLSLTSLQSLDNLRSLNLEETQLRDEFLNPLLFLRELKHLYLKSDFLSDISLQSLSQIPYLTYLGIRGAVLTNSGLQMFKPPSMLQTLDLRECWLLTADAIYGFCKHHPQINMRHESIQNSSTDQPSSSSLFLSNGTNKGTPSKPKRGKQTKQLHLPYGTQRNNFGVMDERIKYSREELLQLQFSKVSLK